jgi:hypothetical protein
VHAAEDPGRRFADLIDAVADGSINAEQALRQFRPELEDGYCVYNLHGEFEAAFANQPARAEALPLIQSLARKIVGYEEDDTLLLFNEPEWKDLVALRGPVEGVEMFRCDNCARTAPQFLMSGFLDLRASTCHDCGEVMFHSTYDDQPLPACRCGGTFTAFSASCGGCGRPLRRIEQVSGYQYFASHKWIQREP